MLASTPMSTAKVEIERLGFKWSEDSQYDLSKLSFDKRVQVRETEHYAPKEIVRQYAIQMKEVAFPPIMITRNDWVIDGNTRFGAHLLNGNKHGPVLIVDAEYGKNPKVDAQLHALAATMNQTGGQRLTPSEGRMVGRKLVKLDWKTEQISRAIGIKSSAVNAIKRELSAEEKFDKVGFTNLKKLPLPVVRAFGMPIVLGLNDVPFRQLADMAVDAGLSATEVRELAMSMKATGSDSGMIQKIADERIAQEQRIKEHALTGNGRPPLAAQLRQRLGLILKYTPQQLVEKVPAKMADHLKDVEGAIAVLVNVRDLQEEAINA